MSSAQSGIDKAIAALEAEDTLAIEEKAKKDSIEDVGSKYTVMMKSLNDMVDVSSNVVRVAGVTYLSNVKADIINVRMDILTLMSNTDLDTRHAIAADIQKRREDIEENLKRFASTNLADEEKEALASFKEKLDEYFAVAQKTASKAIESATSLDGETIELEIEKFGKEDANAKYTFAIKSIDDLIDTSNQIVRIGWITYLNNVKFAIINVRMDLLNMLNASNLLTREACHEMIRSRMGSVEENLKMFEEIGLNEEEKDQLGVVKNGWKAYVSSTQAVADAARKSAKMQREGKDRWSLNQMARRNEREEAGPKFPPAIAAATTMLSVCDNVAKKLYQDSVKKYKSSFLFLTILVLIGVGGGIALCVLILTSITRLFRVLFEGLTGGASQVASASSQISALSQCVSQGANEQAASLETTSSSMEEMSSMVKQNADNAREAARLSTLCTSSAEKGDQAVTEMNGAMKEINTSSKRIADIIKVIDSIAFQTNLLALNAAVEAARAGEHGKGFAVVAEEVRNLAQRSANAAKDTSSLIQDSVQKTDVGTNLAERCGGVLQEIVTNVKKVANLINEIAAASQEQSQGVAQVSKALNEMEQVTQQNASSAEETASSSHQLSAQAKNLMALVEKIDAEIGGTDERIKKEERSMQEPEIVQKKGITETSAESSEHGPEACSETAESSLRAKGEVMPEADSPWRTISSEYVKSSERKTGTGKPKGREIEKLISRPKGNGGDNGGKKASGHSRLKALGRDLLFSNKHSLRKPEEVIPMDKDVFKDF
ncbi:MAG: MCP four helix bundle domain-containing protein [Planctomycetes bacterium]|nr:MCP four helix bundle domain-containing protein [Planctomycetota bacterium]